MRKVQITTPGIKKALRQYNYKQSIAEYMWNGFDAQASDVDLYVRANEIGTISEFAISDNGYGIPYEQLETKFMPFYESEKEIDPEAERNTSAVHGKNGVGRLTFFHFAEAAKWETVFQKGGKNYAYEIMIDARNLDSYSATKPQETSRFPGTTVTFGGIHAVVAQNFETDINEHLQREFGWFLELHFYKSVSITYNDRPLDYSLIIGEKENFPIQLNGTRFDVRYVRWNVSPNREYSRYYYIDSGDNEVSKETTTLNNKGDHFYHSIYIKSGYFDLFTLRQSDKQPSLIGYSKSDETFKNLMDEVNRFLRSKRRPFLHFYSEQVIAEFEKDNAFPKFNGNEWDSYRKQELENVIRELVQVEPKIFTRLNVEQKKTFAHLLNLIIDSGEKDRLFDVLDEIVNLEPVERQQLAALLKASRLSSVIKTIKLIEDRYRTISQLRDLVFMDELKADERHHVQKAVEKHYWIFGEQYHLVTAEEPKFEEALRRYIYLLRGVDEKTYIDHPDKYKEMDIFMVRQNMKDDTIHHVVVELKHPNVRLGEDEVSQVKKYFRVILNEDEFNGPNRFWEFYLVGNKFNGSGFIESELQNARQHGEKSLIFKHDRYKIYVKTWDELFAEFELKHKFLNDKLQIERQKLIEHHEYADDIVTSLATNSAIQPPQVVVPFK